MTKKNVVLAAGGTGGHVFPALALYQELVANDHKVLFLTDKRGQKYLDQIDPHHVQRIDSGGLVTGSFINKIRSLLRLAKGYVKSRQVLSRFKPHVVVGFGGYPSAPPMLAAQHKKIPTLLHEQNSVMGKANRLIAQSANVVATSFEKTKGTSKDAVLVGNPIREAIEHVGTEGFELPTKGQKFQILIMGGSLGAQFLSQAVPEALSKLPSKWRSEIEVFQQVRSEDKASVERVYKNSNISARIEPFISDVASALKSSHLVICRGGATSVCEVAAAGRPAIFIPLDIHADKHQVLNAKALSEKNAAWLQPQSETSPVILSELIVSLLENPKALKQAGDKARASAKLGAAVTLNDLALSISN